MEEKFRELKKNKIVAISIKQFNDFRNYCAERGVIICGGAYVYFMGVITEQYAYPL